MPLLHISNTLDGKQLLQWYLIHGSFRKVAAYIASNGTITSHGRFPNHQTIKNNMWRYCCSHIDESFDTVSSYVISRGFSLSKEDWLTMIAWSARYAMSGKQYQIFLQKNGLGERVLKLTSGEIKYPSIGNINE